MLMKIAPSILSADFAKLGAECEEVLHGGADWIHFDVMDGVFVPNITIGVPVLKTLHRAVDAYYDIHFMIDDPGKYVKTFADCGADMITFHVESKGDPGEILDAIHACGIRGGVALRPGTPAEAVFPYVEKCDMVLVMTVEPGFGGQKFMADMCEKVRAVREYADSIGKKDMLVEVDGGINVSTIVSAASSGADTFVAGSSVFSQEARSSGAIRLMKEAAERSYRRA